MRAAVVGTRWGAVHVAALRAAGADVVAIVDRDAERASSAAEQLRVRTALTRPGQLAELALDLVSVATPAPSHVDVIASLPADLPVLCEKPAIGLSRGPRELRRSAPVWVNYAFSFLGVAERATEVLAELGPVRRARVRSTHDLGRVPLADDAMLFELVPHPLSWLVTALGAPLPKELYAASPRMAVRCGDVPVELSCTPDPGLDGLRHEVVLETAAGLLEVSGTYREGGRWVFAAPQVRLASGGVRVLGEPESGSVDPWYRANERAIGAVVDALRGAPGDERLFDWDTAVAIDLAMRAGLAGRSGHD
jgi:predicted dehydrogenase